LAAFTSGRSGGPGGRLTGPRNCMSALGRRDVLKLLSASASSLLVPKNPLERVFLPSGPPPGALLDVAIVGGGVSGAYAAWPLATPDPASSAILRGLGPRRRLSLGLFELGDRIGGRLRSV